MSGCATAPSMRTFMLYSLCIYALSLQATINDRNWDDWKDHNPRGSGNKANKRY